MNGWIHVDETGDYIEGIIHSRPMWPRCKPEVEFQYGSRLFSETESSNISATDRDIWPKFGQQIYFDSVTSLKPKPKSTFGTRHLEKCRDDNSRPPADVWRHAVRRGHSGATQRSSPTTRWRRRRRKVHLQHQGRYLQNLIWRKLLMIQHHFPVRLSGILNESIVLRVM